MKISNSTIPIILAALAAASVTVPDGVTKKADLFALLPDDQREAEDDEKEPLAIVEETDFIPGEQTDLRVCNLVSQGKTLAEAREIIFGGDNNAGEKSVPVERKNLIGLPVDCPDSREGLFAAFAAAGKTQHPNTPTEKLVAIYRKEILKEVVGEG